MKDLKQLERLTTKASKLIERLSKYNPHVELVDSFTVLIVLETRHKSIVTELSLTDIQVVYHDWDADVEQVLLTTKLSADLNTIYYKMVETYKTFYR